MVNKNFVFYVEGTSNRDIMSSQSSIACGKAQLQVEPFQIDRQLTIRNATHWIETSTIVRIFKSSTMPTYRSCTEGKMVKKALETNISSQGNI